VIAVEGAWHAWCWDLFLTRVSGNGFGPEGARALSEPLGKLTALQQLDLSCKIFHLTLHVRGDVIAVEGAWHAWCWALFLTRVSDNFFGPEGARALSEPLGKLTALQQLDLGGKIFHLTLHVRGDVIAVEGAWHAWCWAFFLTRVSDNEFGPEGARALSEPLGKLTALQRQDLSSIPLDLQGKVFLFVFTCARGCDCG
jgi:hypothetical protein